VITIVSFGWDTGNAPEGTKWIADVRDIDEAVYAAYPDRDGNDPEIRALILATPTAEAWTRKFDLDVVRELADGDVIGVADNDGRVRSVVIANAYLDVARAAGIEAQVEHRDTASAATDTSVILTPIARDTTATIDDMKNVTPIGKHDRSWYEIKNAAGDVAEIFIYDQIGEDWWTGEGITAKGFLNDLAGVKAREIALHVNSPGGSVFDGIAIHNALVNHPAKVTTYIDGIAASIASVIALAGDKIVMADNALFMIHLPWGSVQGTADDMRKQAEVLDKITDTLVSTYQNRTGGDRDDILAALQTETWYSAREAQDVGYVDEISGAQRIAAHFDLAQFGFRHAPKALAEQPGDEQEDLTDSGTDGSSDAGGSDGASEPSKTEAFVEGIGYTRF
jgi:ATP-dependent Clp endopeptidase proteolytic subunit ClpP